MDGEEEEYEETEEDDREKFKDQLCSIGAFCRLVSPHSVPLLSRSVALSLVASWLGWVS